MLKTQHREWSTWHEWPRTLRRSCSRNDINNAHWINESRSSPNSPRTRFVAKWRQPSEHRVRILSRTQVGSWFVFPLSMWKYINSFHDFVRRTMYSCIPICDQLDTLQDVECISSGDKRYFILTGPASDTKPWWNAVNVLATERKRPNSDESKFP